MNEFPGDRARLARILGEVEESKKYLSKGKAAFFDAGDRSTRDGAELHLTHALETAVGMGKSFYQRNPSLPFRRIHEMRQRLTHAYAEVTPDELWRFAREDLPRLERAFRKATTREEER
ncbi:MAG: HepT-like ribonuclease domain-containing protein [Thermoplasmata archaeon]